MGGGAGTPNDGRRRASNAKGAPRRKTCIHISLRPAKQLPVLLGTPGVYEQAGSGVSATVYKLFSSTLFFSDFKILPASRAVARSAGAPSSQAEVIF